MRSLLLIATLGLLSLSTPAQWAGQTMYPTSSYRGVSVVDAKTIWASGTLSAVVRSVDGGIKWDTFRIDAGLDLRDIEAFDANTAYVLAAGEGERSRIYKTIDGGKTWKEQFRNKDPKGFYDALACWDKNNCIAVGDPVDGKFTLLETTDGSTWTSIDTAKMPPAKDGEAAFAASGTCLITQGSKTAFLVTGGSDARVFKSIDRGHTWTVADTDMPKGTASKGIFSIAMLDAKTGIIVGGDYQKPLEKGPFFATTTDGGVTWKKGTGLNYFNSSVIYVDKQTLIAAGTPGSYQSVDGGKTWKLLDSVALNAVQAKGIRAVWGFGDAGFAAHLK